MRDGSLTSIDCASAAQQLARLVSLSQGDGEALLHGSKASQPPGLYVMTASTGQGLSRPQDPVVCKIQGGIPLLARPAGYHAAGWLIPACLARPLTSAICSLLLASHRVGGLGGRHGEHQSSLASIYGGDGAAWLQQRRKPRAGKRMQADRTGQHSTHKLPWCASVSAP